MSVVLVIAVGLFFLRDNIAKFINNAATQIAGEESGEQLNEYGFYYERRYVNEYGTGYIFYEDGSVEFFGGGGSVFYPEGSFAYSNGSANDVNNEISYTFTPDGKTCEIQGAYGAIYNLEE